MFDILMQAITFAENCLQNERNRDENENNGRGHEHIGFSTIDTFFDFF